MRFDNDEANSHLSQPPHLGDLLAPLSFKTIASSATSELPNQDLLLTYLVCHSLYLIIMRRHTIWHSLPAQTTFVDPSFKTIDSSATSEVPKRHLLIKSVLFHKSQGPGRPHHPPPRPPPKPGRTPNDCFWSGCTR